MLKMLLTEDIEAYLSTFDLLMEAFTFKKEFWTYKLSPQLTGKAQQAFAAMGRANAADYAEVKAAILHRYDIIEKTYRQWFQSAKRGEGKQHMYLELVICLHDLLEKWMKTCDTLEKVKEKIVIEQVLKTMPQDLRMWLQDRKPTSEDQTGQLSDDYAHSRQ